MFSSDDEGQKRVHLKSRHGCTDVPCCILFLCVLGAFAALNMWCVQSGNIGRLGHGIDYEGQACGVDPKVVDRPYLYWCAKSTVDGILHVELESPVCVGHCPGSGSKDYSSSSFEEVPQCGAVTGPEGISSYKTRTLLHRFCVPHTGHGDYKAVAKRLAGGRLGGWRETSMRSLASIPAAWPVFLGVFLVSILAAHVYLCLLRSCAEVLIWVSMGLCIVGFGWLGIYLWTNSEMLESQFEEQELNSSETPLTKVLAMVCWVLAFAVACMACCLRHSVAAATACLELAVDEMFRMPSLLLTPLMKALVKGCLSILLLGGFITVYSMGYASDADSTWESLPLSPEHRYYCMIGFYLVVSLWILAFVSALYQFTVAYAVADYYYTEYEDGEKDVGCCAIWDGLHLGLVYHTGSLAFGSLLIAILQAFSKVLEYAQRKNEEEGDNYALSCILCCCICCVHCCKDIVEFVDKNAYIEMAITSKDFCGSAKEAIAMIVKLGGSMAILNGATFVFSVFGTIVISLTSGAFADIICAHGPFADQSSPFHVASPSTVMLLSALMGFLVALTFMDVLDMTSDTLLYCYGVDMQTGRAGHTAPAALKDLVHSGEHGDDPRRH